MTRPPNLQVTTRAMSPEELRAELTGGPLKPFDAPTPPKSSKGVIVREERSGDVLHRRNEPTKVEQRMATELDLQLRAGEIVWYAAQSFKIRLADRTWYTPDFVVFHLCGHWEFRETKGSWKMPHQDDSRVKIKVAAEQYPRFWFSAWVPDGAGWKREWWNREASE